MAPRPAERKRAVGALVGIVEAEPGQKRVRSLKLVTDQAFYRGAGADQPFGAAVELPRESE